MTLIWKCLDGKWVNIILIAIPYILYWLLILIYGTKMFPMNTDPSDYGVGLIGVYDSLLQWISVVIASIIGIYLKMKQ